MIIRYDYWIWFLNMHIHNLHNLIVYHLDTFLEKSTIIRTCRSHQIRSRPLWRAWIFSPSEPRLPFVGAAGRWIGGADGVFYGLFEELEMGGLWWKSYEQQKWFGGSTNFRKPPENEWKLKKKAIPSNFFGWCLLFVVEASCISGPITGWSNSNRCSDTEMIPHCWHDPSFLPRPGQSLPPNSWNIFNICQNSGISNIRIETWGSRPMIIYTIS